MRFVFNPASLPETLMMTLKGMVGIFVVIGVIMLAIWVLNKIAKPTDNSSLHRSRNARCTAWTGSDFCLYRHVHHTDTLFQQGTEPNE